MPRKPKEPDPSDIELFWALHNRTVEELPGLDEILQKHELPADPHQIRVSNADVQQFLNEARERGLLPPKPLSLREYIGAILP